ncbi:MAG: [acyl-carrier-protein] S-malonyltransferase, partial [Acidobacteriaceae bacterium]|nr:[acyl-carrier-protein] S-malonyltransferase [Acidobacteriaceae bacterium]
EADAALGYSLSKLCFEGPAEQLKQTEFTQPAIFAVSMAAYRVLASRGIEPQIVAGHSLGEYAACAAAGVMSFADAIRALRSRGQFMQEAVPEGQGAMAAILGMDADAVRAVCEAAAKETNEVVSPANLNSPEQIVISGSTAGVARASELAKERGAKKVVPLQVSAPFHCALMQPAQDRLAEVLKAVKVHDPRFPIVANVTADVTKDGGKERDLLVRQVTAPVRWVESMRRMIDAGGSLFVEVGPGKVLTGLLRQIDRAQKCVNVEDAASLEKALSS